MSKKNKNEINEILKGMQLANKESESIKGGSSCKICSLCCYDCILSVCTTCTGCIGDTDGATK